MLFLDMEVFIIKRQLIVGLIFILAVFALVFSKFLNPSDDVANTLPEDTPSTLPVEATKPSEEVSYILSSETYNSELEKAKKASERIQSVNDRTHFIEQDSYKAFVTGVGASEIERVQHRPATFSVYTYANTNTVTPDSNTTDSTLSDTPSETEELKVEHGL